MIGNWFLTFFFLLKDKNPVKWWKFWLLGHCLHNIFSKVCSYLIFFFKIAKKKVRMGSFFRVGRVIGILTFSFFFFFALSLIFFFNLIEAIYWLGTSEPQQRFPGSHSSSYFQQTLGLIFWMTNVVPMKYSSSSCNKRCLRKTEPQIVDRL